MNGLSAWLLTRGLGCGKPLQGQRSHGCLSPFQEALQNGLVATEVLMWFYIGEIIGKRGLIGYNV